MHSWPKTAMLTALAAQLCSCGGAHKSDDSKMLARFQVFSKAKISLFLKDPDSAKYDDVKTFKLKLDNSTGYVFCGNGNSKSGFGGYGGMERFIANPGIAVVESQMADFTSIWLKMCDPVNDVGSIWW